MRNIHTRGLNPVRGERCAAYLGSYIRQVFPSNSSPSEFPLVAGKRESRRTYSTVVAGKRRGDFTDSKRCLEVSGDRIRGKRAWNVAVFNISPAPLPACSQEYPRSFYAREAIIGTSNFSTNKRMSNILVRGKSVA